MPKQLWWKRSRGDRLKQALCERVDWQQIYSQVFDWKPGQNIKCFVAPKSEAHGFEEESRPSLGVIPESPGAVNCFTCGYKASSFIGVLEDFWGKPFEDVCAHLYSKLIEPTVAESTVSSLEKVLWKDDELLLKVREALRLPDDLMKKWRLGWSIKRRRLTIPIFNEFGLIVDIRCYDALRLNLADDPEAAKTISWKKGFGGARLFPFSAEKLVVLTEGEKDLLAGQHIGLPCQTITSGARTVLDEKDAKRHFQGKRVIIPADNDPAGKVGAVRRASMVKAAGGEPVVLELPVKEKKEDLWDWVFKYGGTSKKFWQLVKDAGGGVAQDLPAVNPVGQGMGDLFGSKSKSSVDVAVAIQVFESMRAKGWFYRYDGGLYYANAHECVHVHRSDPLFRSMMARIDPHINRETATGKVVLEHIENAGWACAEDVNVSNQSYYSLKGRALYVRTSRKTQHIYKVSAKGVTKVKNAQNKGRVLLALYDDAFKDMGDIPPGTKWKPAIKWAWDEVFRFMPMPDSQRCMVFSWFLAGFFKQITPDRPILRVMAPSQHGKSHALRMLSLLMYGSECLNGPNSTVASISTNAVKRPMLFIDNIEMEHVVKREGLNDLFISLATNAAKEKRRSGTDTGVVYERPDCITATTGIEPFDRHEIINRFLYATINRNKYGRNDYFDFLRFAKIIENRDWVLWGLYQACVDLLPTLHERVEQLARKHAMADYFIRYPVYLALMEVWTSVLCSVIDVRDQKGDVMLSGEVIDSIVALQAEQMSVHNEGTNPVLSWLNTLWERTCGAEPSFLESAHRPNIDRVNKVCTWWMTTQELLNELSVLARQLNRRVPWHNAQQLGCRITDCEEMLARDGWEVQRVKSNGREFKKIIKHGLPLKDSEVEAKRDRPKRRPKGIGKA